MTTIVFPLLLQTDNSLAVVLSQPNAVGLALGNVHCGGWENMDSSLQERLPVQGACEQTTSQVWVLTAAKQASGVRAAVLASSGVQRGEQTLPKDRPQFQGRLQCC